VAVYDKNQADQTDHRVRIRRITRILGGKTSWKTPIALSGGEQRIISNNGRQYRARLVGKSVVNSMFESKWFFLPELSFWQIRNM